MTISYAVDDPDNWDEIEKWWISVRDFTSPRSRMAWHYCDGDVTYLSDSIFMIRLQQKTIVVRDDLKRFQPPTSRNPLSQKHVRSMVDAVDAVPEQTWEKLPTAMTIYASRVVQMLETQLCGMLINVDFLSWLIAEFGSEECEVCASPDEGEFGRPLLFRWKKRRVAACVACLEPE